jgi:hypothetical protein
MLGWTQEDSPFHQGELAIQTRLGIQGKVNMRYFLNLDVLKFSAFSQQHITRDFYLC